MQCVLEMCDIQAITGLAILMSGFISLNHTDAPLTASDWQMLVYLVWFSTSTHLAGLISLRAYLNARPRLSIPPNSHLVTSMLASGGHGADGVLRLGIL